MREYRAMLPTQSVVYQDTDSLWVLADRQPDLPGWGDRVEGGPGSLRLVDHYHSVVLLGKRTYWAGGHWVLAGVPRPVQLDDGGCWTVEQIDGAATVCHRGPQHGTRVRKYRRRWRVCDPGGHVTPSGWVEPFEVNSPR